jgi:hypothetical protein
MELIKDRPWLVLCTIIPRLCLIGFTFAQPFLIERATEYMRSPIDQDTYKVGGALIAAYFLVYVGLGVSIVGRTYRHMLTDCRSLNFFIAKAQLALLPPYGQNLLPESTHTP